MTNTRSADLLSLRERVVARGVANAHPVIAAKAEGTVLWDIDGQRYLDFVGGIGVLNVGHNHPRVVSAVRAQLERFSHTCFQVAMYEPYLRLAERLGTLIGGSEDFKSVFLTTGAEATENAIKIARAYTNRPGIIAFHGAFHGRTLMCMTLTALGQTYKQNFGPFAPDVYHAPYPDAYRGWTTERALEGLNTLMSTQVEPARVAAVIIEPQLGDGGFVSAPPEFLRALRELTQQHGIVLIADEIQTGFGRTGSMFAYQHAQIEPDLVTVAKSLAGGLPLSGVIGKAAIMDAALPGGLGGTYAGSPLACAAALAVLDVFEQEGLVERARSLGERLRMGLHAIQGRFEAVGDVRGLGAMLAVELVSDRAARTPDAALTGRVLDAARRRGLLVIRCGVHKNVVRFLPPLVTRDEQIDEALAIFEQSLQEATT